MISAQVNAFKRALRECKKVCNLPCVDVQVRRSSAGPKKSSEDGEFDLFDKKDYDLSAQNRKIGSGKNEKNEIPITITQDKMKQGNNPALGVSSEGGGVMLSGTAIREVTKGVPPPVNTLAHEIGHHAGYLDPQNPRDPLHAQRKENEHNLMDQSPSPNAKPDAQWCDKVYKLSQ